VAVNVAGSGIIGGASEYADKLAHGNAVSTPELIRATVLGASGGVLGSAFGESVDFVKKFRIDRQLETMSGSERAILYQRAEFNQSPLSVKGTIITTFDVIGTAVSSVPAAVDRVSP